MKSINRDIVGAFIVSNDGYILLGKSKKGGVYQGVWVVPGGGIEPGETWEEAMRREVREEVGMELDDAEITPLHDEFLTGESEKVINGETVLVRMKFHDFLVEFPKAHTDIHFENQEELAEARWLKLADITADMLGPGVSYRLRKLGYIA
jgi:8-oxo-dGTP pyrophosphatase MutT (NUDIX family)